MGAQPGRFCKGTELWCTHHANNMITGGPRKVMRASETPDLPLLVECLPPLLFEIAGYAALNPQDLANLSMAARSVVQQLERVVDSLWGSLYERRWPAFHESLRYQGAMDWKSLYHDTLGGRCECTLEVFDREKKLGFAMAAMAARIQYEARLDAYIARYLSASEIFPETIPHFEEHRLRFCPESARSRLRPGYPLASCAIGDARIDSNAEQAKDARVDINAEQAKDARIDSNAEQAKAAACSPSYPYRVLEGFKDLKVGGGVELQWKMQFGSPFGWWYGHLEALHVDPDGTRATATLTFRHFPSTSRWYRLDVQFGDSEMRPCAFGGYTGGIRAASEAESKRWMRFFPKELVVF